MTLTIDCGKHTRFLWKSIELVATGQKRWLLPCVYIRSRGEKRWQGTWERIWKSFLWFIVCLNLCARGEKGTSVILRSVEELTGRLFSLFNFSCFLWGVTKTELVDSLDLFYWNIIELDLHLLLPGLQKA